MEYGGCLHFEINKKNSGYYAEYESSMIDVDCGRSALQYILENYRFQRIWLPIYNCPTVEKRIKEISDIEICWYNINNLFLPDLEIEHLKSGDVLLWVNYFGMMPDSVIDSVVDLQNYCDVRIIVDNIPAYFSKPRLKAFNMYSCRKFIGVPDGGHVIGNSVIKTELPLYSTADNYYYLLKAIETGSNSAYGDYQESEKRFLKSRTAFGMPKLTKRILESVDYEKIIIKRKENFLALHEILKNSNRMDINISTNTPSVYPYLTTSKQLRDKLIDNKIYISRFWKHVLTNELANDFEKDLAEYLIPLPIDQRYERSDMNYIASKVIELERISGNE